MGAGHDYSEMFQNIDSSKNELFYCASYQAFLMGLYLVHSGKKIIFITQNENIFRTCEILNIKVIKIDEFSPKQIYLNSQYVKKYINHLCNLGNGVPLHFTHTQFDVFCFLLVDRYSKVGPVLFYNFEAQYDLVERLIMRYGFIKKLFLKLWLKVLYGNECVIKTINNRYLIGVDKKFMNRNNIKIIDNKNFYYDQIEKAIRAYQIELNICDNLYLLVDFSNFVTKKSIDEIYNFLNRKNFFVKAHPRCPIVDKMLINMPQYPSYLPSELIFRNVAKSVTAIYSSSLISASKNFNLKSISLIELVDWSNNNYKKVIKEDLVSNSNGKILFPTSFDELSDLL